MQYKDINDYEVIYMIKENNSEEAEQTIYSKYLPVIKKVAQKYYSKICMTSDFEDLLQEGYIGLSKAIKSFTDNYDVLFYTFAHICIERQIKNYCRRMLTAKSLSLNTAISIDDDSKEITLPIEDNSMEPSTLVVDSENIKKVVEFKNSLDFEYSNIFELRLNGFSYKEIAKLLDLSVSTVDGRLCKVRKLLRDFN